MSIFETDIAALINTHSLENESNTPDFILAAYLQSCLDVFTLAIRTRETWYGRADRPGVPAGLDPSAGTERKYDVIELEEISTCPDCGGRNWNVVETRSSKGPFCRCAECGWTANKNEG